MVEPDEAATARAKDRYAELPDTPRVKHLTFVESVRHVSGPIDLCIVSTSADVRFDLTKELLERVSVRNILFEKVLFQRLEHYGAMHALHPR